MAMAMPMKRQMEECDGDLQVAKRGGGYGGPRQGLPCCLKILAPEALASAVIGKGGQVIKALRESTGTKLTFTGRDEIYPGTDCRVLTAQGESEEALAELAAQIVLKLSECAEATPSESLGSPGELRIKMLVPRASAGGLIGKSGSCIKQMREQTGAKINIAEPCEAGPQADQLLTVSGTALALEQVMAEANRQVQKVCAEPWFAPWAASSGAGAGHGKGGGRPGPQDAGKGGWGKSHVGHSGPPPQHRQPGPAPGPAYGAQRQPPPQTHAHPGAIGGSAQPQMIGGGSGGLVMDVMRSMPSHMLDDPRGFCLTCIVPGNLCGGLIGRGGVVTREVEARTGAKVAIREMPDGECRNMTITGPMQSAVAAYMLMMKRYLEVEAEAAALR